MIRRENLYLCEYIAEKKLIKNYEIDSYSDELFFTEKKNMKYTSIMMKNVFWKPVKNDENTRKCGLLKINIKIIRE